MTMTWKEWMVKHLVDNGLFDSQAEAVVTAYLSAEGHDELSDLAGHAQEGYPPQVTAVVLVGLHHAALEWIDANMPQHWARPMFLPPGAPA